LIAASGPRFAGTYTAPEPIGVFQILVEEKGQSQGSRNACALAELNPRADTVTTKSDVEGHDFIKTSTRQLHNLLSFHER